MKLAENIFIAPAKLTDYLFVFKKNNDKSQWLAQAGYTLETRRVLQDDLRMLLKTNDAVLIEKTEYGKMYEIKGELTGPDKISLYVCTIWIIEIETGITKFITMYPDKRK